MPVIRFCSSVIYSHPSSLAWWSVRILLVHTRKRLSPKASTFTTRRDGPRLRPRHLADDQPLGIVGLLRYRGLHHRHAGLLDDSLRLNGHEVIVGACIALAIGRPHDSRTTAFVVRTPIPSGSTAASSR